MNRISLRPLSLVERDLKDQCEEVIRAGLTTFAEVGQALLTVRDQRLYRDHYPTFEEYAAGKWQISRPRAYELMRATAIVSAIADIGLPAPVNEGQARELARVPEADRPEVWRRTLTDTDGHPTATAIKNAARSTANDLTGSGSAMARRLQ